MCRGVVLALGRDRQGDTKFKLILFGYRVSLKPTRATEKRERKRTEWGRKEGEEI